MGRPLSAREKRALPVFLCKVAHKSSWQAKSQVEAPKCNAKWNVSRLETWSAATQDNVRKLGKAVACPPVRPNINYANELNCFGQAHRPTLPRASVWAWQQIVSTSFPTSFVARARREQADGRWGVFYNSFLVLISLICISKQSPQRSLCHGVEPWIT